MRQVKMDDVVEYAKVLQGRVMPTLGGKSTFAIEVTPRGFIYTPTSTGKPRMHQYIFVQRLLDRFNKKRSFRLVDYRDLTKNASYFLYILKAFVEERNGSSI
jgi:hypothetical protein